MRSVRDPDANGQPHFENGLFHLYLSALGVWCISIRFDPQQTGSTYVATSGGGLPEGLKEWNDYADGKWRKLPLRLVKLSEQELRARKVAFVISGHQKAEVNNLWFTQSASDPEANGQPHYENGLFHLYFSAIGVWCINSRFEPTRTSPCTYLVEASNGSVPEGEREWMDLVVGRWVKQQIKITRVVRSMQQIASQRADDDDSDDLFILSTLAVLNNAKARRS